LANFQLLNNRKYSFPIVDRDAAGDIVPASPADVDSVVSSMPASVAMAIGVVPALNDDGTPNPHAGGPSVECTPMVILSDASNGGGSIEAVVSDSAGLAKFQTYLFDVVQNLTPTTIGLDLGSGVTTTSQPVPTAPGP
jgi:hypothetical protein